MSNLSDIKSIALINIGNIFPALISAVLLPYYLIAMDENYYSLSLILLILNGLLVFESGISRITALNVQLINDRCGDESEVISEISHGIISLIVVLFTSIILALIVNSYVKLLTLYQIMNLSIFLIILCLGAMLRALQEVEGGYFHFSVAKTIYSLLLNAGIVYSIYLQDMSITALTNVAIVAKFIEVCYLSYFHNYKFNFTWVSTEKVLLNLKKTTANFLSNVLSSSFLFVDKNVIFVTVSSANASIYMGTQDIVLKYAIVLSSFTTLFLKNANNSSRKNILISWMGLFHIIISIFALTALDLLNLDIGVISSDATLLFIVFLIGIFFNIAASLELVQLQSRGKYTLIMRIQFFELFFFALVLYVTSFFASIMLIAIVWSGRMIIDYLLLNYNNRLSVQ